MESSAGSRRSQCIPSWDRSSLQHLNAHIFSAPCPALLCSALRPRMQSSAHEEELKPTWEQKCGPPPRCCCKKALLIRTTGSSRGHFHRSSPERLNQIPSGDLLCDRPSDQPSARRWGTAKKYCSLATTAPLLPGFRVLAEHGCVPVCARGRVHVDVQT